MVRMTPRTHTALVGNEELEPFASDAVVDATSRAVTILVDEEGWSEDKAFNAVTDLHTPEQFENWLKQEGGDIERTARFIVGTVTLLEEDDGKTTQDYSALEDEDDDSLDDDDYDDDEDNPYLREGVNPQDYSTLDDEDDDSFDDDDEDSPHQSPV